jgi:hypothetical protein
MAQNLQFIINQNHIEVKGGHSKYGYEVETGLSLICRRQKKCTEDKDMARHLTVN